MDSGRTSSSSSSKMTPSYKCSFAGRPFIQLRQTREILQKLSKVTKRFENVIKMDHNDDNISGDVSTKKMSLVKLLL